MKKIFAAFICTFFILSVCQAEEISFEPCGDTEQIISNVFFDDLYKIPHISFAQDCVALGLMFGDGQNFNAESGMTNENALRILYRTAGREDEGYAAAYNTELRAAAGLGDFDWLSSGDGFYLLARRDGLITDAEFVSAYTDPASTLARATPATVNNFVKWFCLLHGIKTSGSLSGNFSIDSAYMAYYSALKNYYILSDEDIRTVSAYYTLTNDIAAYILKKAESRIIGKIGIQRITGRITKVYEHTEADSIRREITVLSNNAYYTLKSNSSKNGAFFNVRSDYPVLSKSGTDLSGSLRENDRITVYIKDGKILFVRNETVNKNAEYLGAPLIFSGKFYVYDYTKNELVLGGVKKSDKDIDGYMKCYLNLDTKFYYNGNIIDKYTLNTEFADRECTVFMLPSVHGGMERVYSIVFE